SAALGGAASVAGGGKFENGAITGAFGYLFNSLGKSATSNNGGSNGTPWIGPAGPQEADGFGFVAGGSVEGGLGAFGGAGGNASLAGGVLWGGSDGLVA